MKKLFAVIFFVAIITPCFRAYCAAPDFAGTVGDFMLFRMRLSEVAESGMKMSEIERYEKKLFGGENAFAEDERIIMENYIAMEKYNALFGDKAKVKGVQKILKGQKEKMDGYISAHEGKEMSKWFWCSYGDTVSCMMSFSVSDVMKYGVQVKDYYIKSLEADENYCYALMNLGQWYYWAPRIAGGGKDKAASLFERAFTQARTQDEIYFCGIVYSQSLFEGGRKEEARKVLLKAQEQWPESKAVEEIISLNDRGLSIYQAGKVGQVGD